MHSLFHEIAPFTQRWEFNKMGSGVFRNVSSEYEKLKLAKFIFLSDGYVLLPRRLRYALVHYIIFVMLALNRIYEPDA